jgi:amino acid transporter
MIYILLGYIFVAISDFFLIRYLNKGEPESNKVDLNLAMKMSFIPLVNIISFFMAIYVVLHRFFSSNEKFNTFMQYLKRWYLC